MSEKEIIMLYANAYEYLNKAMQIVLDYVDELPDIACGEMEKSNKILELIAQKMREESHE